jgi:DNA repair ATPase RecN
LTLVSKLQENKSKRQIIVVTHNPNIVVNGDSEYVVALQDKGQIEVSAEGALQELIVRKNVCEIMEGGEIALEQRYKRLFNV